MNKAITKKDINLQISDTFNKATDIDSSNYRVFLNNLDIECTIRIYNLLDYRATQWLQLLLKIKRF